jgi:hypothetical protein
MHTIQLKVKNCAYEKLLKLLSNFSNDEIEILYKSSEYQKDKAYLQKELDEIESGNAEFVSHVDFENLLNQAINKHESDL